MSSFEEVGGAIAGLVFGSILILVIAEALDPMTSADLSSIAIWLIVCAVILTIVTIVGILKQVFSGK